MQHTIALLLIDLQQGLDIAFHEKCSTSYKDTGASPTKNSVGDFFAATGCFTLTGMRSSGHPDKRSHQQQKVAKRVVCVSRSGPCHFIDYRRCFLFRIREISRWVIIGSQSLGATAESLGFSRFR